MPIDKKILERLQNNAPHLVQLKLSFKKLSAEDIRNLYLALVNNTILKTLKLESNSITCSESTLLAVLPNLTVLDLARNQIKTDGAKALAQRSGLRYLDICDNPIGRDGALALAKHPSLTALNLSFCEVDEACVEILADNLLLTTLRLMNTKIGNQGSIRLAQSHSITELDVSLNDIKAGGAKALASCKPLVKLCLYHNKIGEEGAVALAAHPGLLDLRVDRNNNIGNAGIEALAKNHTLTNLNINKTGIDHTGAQYFLANMLLTSLYIGENDIDDTLLQDLEKHIAENVKRIERSRDDFVVSLLIMARALAKSPAQCAFNHLSADVFLYIFSFMHFSYLGKDRRQGHAMVHFVLQNLSLIEDALHNEEVEDIRFIERTQLEVSSLISRRGLFRFQTSATLPSSWGNHQQTVEDERASKRLRL